MDGKVVKVSPFVRDFRLELWKRHLGLCAGEMERIRV